MNKIEFLKLHCLAKMGDKEALYKLSGCYLFGLGCDVDITKGYHLLKKSAKYGFEPAQISLDYMFDNNDEAIRFSNEFAEHYEAVKRLRQAAEDGDAFAQYFIAESRVKDDSVSQYVKQEGFKWLKKSAAQNFGPALYLLGIKYLEGDSDILQKNEKLGAELLKKSADKGHLPAIMKVAAFYAEGTFFNQDFKEAIKYYKMAADKDNPQALVILGKNLSSGRFIGQNLELAKKYFQKAIELQYIPAYYELGLLYCREEHRDAIEAFKNFSIAANAGFPPAEYELGVCYRWGEGVPADIQKAIYWMELSANKGYSMAKHNLGLYYENGIGVESNIQKAIQYYTQAAEDEENYQAQFCLGRCYFNGNGVEQNYNEAIKWFMKAASQGEPDSIFHLAICYGNGLGVEQDNEKSLHYLITAANLGWQPAIEILKENGIEPTNK